MAFILGFLLILCMFVAIVYGAEWVAGGSLLLAIIMFAKDLRSKI